MRYCKMVIVCMMVCSCSALRQSSGEYGVNEKYFFGQINQEQNAQIYRDVHEVLAMYYEGVEKADSHLLQEAFHETWVMRDTDTPNESTLNVEDKATFDKRVRDHGPYLGYASARQIASFDLAYDRLAFVRINKDPSRNSTGFFLFKLGDNWSIMDKLFVAPRDESASTRQGQGSYALVEKLLHNYFRALAKADRGVLETMLHEDWDSKLIDKRGTLSRRSKVELLAGLESYPPIDYSQLMRIDLYHDKLAIVRIDLPSTFSTLFLTVFKIKGTWQIGMERGCHFAQIKS